MLRKLAVVSGVVLYSLSSFGSDVNKIDINWEMGSNPYRMTTENVYDENRVTTFNHIVADYLSRDSETTEDHKTFYKNNLQSRADSLKNGENSLLLLYKHDKIFGGTYISFEEAGKTIRMSCAGYADLPFMELRCAQKRMLDELASSKNFPKAQRLVLFLPTYSTHHQALRMIGYKQSAYIVDEHPIDQYTCFEMAMS